MPLNGVTSVLRVLGTRTPEDVELDDLPAPTNTRELRRLSVARSLGTYLARSGTSTAQVDRETARDLRRLGARYIGHEQPDPLWGN